MFSLLHVECKTFWNSLRFTASLHHV
jgi:hypothetical protein